MNKIQRARELARKESSNTYIAAILDQFRNKAGAWQSQHKAEKLLSELKELLTEAEYLKLSVAHGHYQLGEGAEELYDVCKGLLLKYTNDQAAV